MIPPFLVNSEPRNAAEMTAALVRLLRRNRRIELATAQDIAMRAIYGALFEASEAERVKH
jgi:hypothetical protein